MLLTITSMDTTSPESRDRLRQAIINEIHTLEASTRALKSRHNELAPISRLPCEVLAAIFSFLSVYAWNEGSGLFAWIYVARVCRRWRETALNHPHFWSHINLTKLTPVGMAGILSRAKMAPLHLAADYTKLNVAHHEVFQRQLEAHISHTRHLRFSGYHLSTVVERLVSPAPALESLSLSSKLHSYRLHYAIIPDDLFRCTTPCLTSLKLEKCDIGWKSPLLKGLRILEILDLSDQARPELNDWLDALNEMPQLKELSLRSATPLAPPTDPLISRTATLPSLTHFHIGASAKDCAHALAHLVLPILTWLHVDVSSHNWEGEDVLLVIPYVIRNVYELQDIEPIRSILIAGERKCAEVLTWTTPGADVKVCGPDTLKDMSRSACLLFSAKCDYWNYGVDTAIFDALLTLLPMNSVSTLTAQNRTRLSKKFWLGHAPRWPLLEQARLVPTSVGAFGEMLAEDRPPDCPRLPSLTKLVLLDSTLTTLRTYHLRDMFMRRVEQGVPLEVLDLRTCFATNPAIQLLAEIVVDVQEPLDAPPMATEEFFNRHGEIEYYDDVGFDDGRASWYSNTDDDEDDDGDEDEDDDDDDDENEDEEEYETDYDDGSDFGDDQLY
jgi:F-box-like